MTIAYSKKTLVANPNKYSKYSKPNTKQQNIQCTIRDVIQERKFLW